MWYTYTTYCTPGTTRRVVVHVVPGYPVVQVYEYKYKFYTVSFQLKSFLFFYFLFCSTTNILVKVRYSDSTSDNRALFINLQVCFFGEVFISFLIFFFFRGIGRNRVVPCRKTVMCCCVVVVVVVVLGEQ